MATASEDAGLTKSNLPEETQGQKDAGNAVKEAEEALAAAKKVQADEQAGNTGTAADTVGNGEASTTSDSQAADSTATTVENTPGSVPDYPSVAELAEAANTLRSATQTRVAAFLDQVSEGLIAQGLVEGGSPAAPEDPTGTVDSDTPTPPSSAS